MKLFEKTFVRGGCYSFFIILALLLISSAMGFDEHGNSLIVLDVPQVLFCSVSGYAVALAGLIFETKLDPIFKRLIHFIVLLAAFIFIFATGAFGGNSLSTKILAGIVLFTFAYIAVSLLLLGVKKLFALVEKKYSAKSEAEKNDTQKPYTPRYK
ncbi:MAG: hypothetical protein IKB38_02620 [Clostridia bacterium]|nr:hypothetical protein [Clostridia bacterium]